MIKDDAKLNHFNRRPIEANLAMKLGECFDITFGRESGRFGTWFGEPNTIAKERFGLNREVLIVYSAHRQTDARAFTAIENTLRNPDFRTRLDQIFVILIHQGDPDETRELARQSPDRIVVPFLAAELSNSNRGALFVRQRIATVTAGVDLFGLSSPLKTDRQLFGRDELVQSLVNRALLSGESSGVFGLRKTGKTSVLYAVRRRISERGGATLYLDCSGVGRHSLRWFQLLDAIIDELASVLQARRERGESYSDTDAGQRFSLDLRAMLGAGKLSHVVLMLDEIEYITPTVSGHLGQHWDLDFVPFWQTVRSTVQESFGKFSFIVAGVNPASVEKTHFGTTPNPIIQLAVPHYLEPLPQQSVREMVRTTGRYAGLTFDEDVYGYLGSEYGGHPYLIRLACSVVWRHSDLTSPTNTTRISIEDFEQRKPEIRTRIAVPIRDILLSLVWWYPEQYEILFQLAEGEVDFVKAYLAESPDSATQFAKYGLLAVDTGRFSIADLKEFLHEKGDSFRNEISPFTRGDIPPEKLPDVPDLTSLATLQLRKNKMEVLTRRAILMYLGFECGFDDQRIAKSLVKTLQLWSDKNRRSSSYRDKFVGLPPKLIVNELFVEELGALIEGNWETFRGLFGLNQDARIQFQMNIRTINVSRRIPAHANASVTAEEATSFFSSYDWLFVRLKKIPDILSDLPPELAQI